MFLTSIKCNYTNDNVLVPYKILWSAIVLELQQQSFADICVIDLNVQERTEEYCYTVKWTGDKLV